MLPYKLFLLQVKSTKPIHKQLLYKTKLLLYLYKNIKHIKNKERTSPFNIATVKKTH